MFAYYDDGKIIGYYSLALQDNNECELNNLCVLPQYRHKHIGAKLLEDARHGKKVVFPVGVSGYMYWSTDMWKTTPCLYGKHPDSS